MKRIRNIRDLENEKLRLRVKQLELERQLDRTWKGLRNNFSTNKVAEQKQPAPGFNFKTGNTILDEALNYGAFFLTHKLGMIAGNKVENAAEQILGNWSQKLNLIVSKKKRFQKN